MKSYILPLLCSGALIIASCGSDTEGGKSTPIDSTVQNGTAPVDYQGGTPTETIDTTMQRRDAMRGDTMGQSTAPMNQPNGNGANSSNTTDKRTTSGSSANGDADGDRKR
jgi:hypothetical protein